MRNWLALAIVAGLLLSAACKDNKDTISPAVEITAPAAGDTLMPGDSVTLTAHATDNKAVKVVEFFSDAVKIGQQEIGTSDNYTMVWSVPLETLGATHVLIAKALDSADNFAADSVTIYIRKTGGVGKYHGGPITVSETWSPADNPHVCTTNVTVAGGAKLTILPACDVKFEAGTGIKVGQGSGGELVAIGKPDSLITFKSRAASPARGDWAGLGFYGSTGTATHLSYCKVSHGGLSGGAAILLDGSATAIIDNCTIEQSAGYGVWYANDGRFAGFQDNKVTGCTRYPVRIKAEFVRDFGTGNQFAGNDLDGVYVDGSPVTTTALWRNLGVPYRVNGSVAIGDASRPVVTIEPGTTVKLGQYAGIWVGVETLPGGLRADGSGGQQILFTSSLATPGRGDWQYIYFDDAAIDNECVLKNCRFVYGGGNLDGNLFLFNAKPEIRACAVDSSAGYGIYLYGVPSELPRRDSLIANNTFSGDSMGDVNRP